MPPSGREYLSLIWKCTWSIDVSPMRAQKVTPVRKLLSLGSRPSAPPSTDPQAIDTLRTAHIEKPCPVTCSAYLLPQRPPGIDSASAPPSGWVAAPAAVDIGSPPAHQAPLRPPPLTGAKAGDPMS